MDYPYKRLMLIVLHFQFYQIKNQKKKICHYETFKNFHQKEESPLLIILSYLKGYLLFI